jgi:NAD+ diphosphatase
MSFDADFDSEITAADGHWIIGVVGSRLLMNQTDQSFMLPHDQLRDAVIDAPLERLYLGRWHGTPCFAFIYPADLELPSTSGLVTTGLRSRLGLVADELFSLAGRAQQLAHWYEFHRYCGRCGRANRLELHERVLACSHCGALYYPRIAPCVIGIVVRERTCLLAHNANFAEGLYSVIAGFIEPGETAEQALVREIREETGIEVERLEYVCSQPWPFPSQLMLGFIAHYKSGEIQVDGVEITDAGWFPPDALPPVPPARTISGKLIDIFLQRVHAQG